MERYADLVVSKIPEMGFTNLLCHIYHTVGLSASLDVSRFTTNCNGYVVARLDPSPSAGKVSCVPIAQLMELVRSKHLPAPDPNAAELDAKQFLVAALKKKYPRFEDVCALPTSVPLTYFFKPKLRERVSRAVDFSQMDLRADDLSRRGVATGVNEKVVKLAVRPEREAWMSNRSIHHLLEPMAHGTDVTYMGQLNLNFLGSVPIHEKMHAFSESVISYVLKDRIGSATTRYVMFGFCYRSHWKSAVFDRKGKLLAFYDSGGSNPAEFYHYPNFFFYSFSDGFNANKSSARLSDENADIDALFRFFVDFFGAKQGCINVETNQLLASECGMFTSLFMIVCVLHPPADFKALRRLYMFFRFMADKKMTLFKSILFNPNPCTVDVTPTQSDGLREYLKMERWTRKSLSVLSERITSRINKLFPDSE